LIASGNHTFFVSSDDESKVYLSTDMNPSNKVQICGVYWSPEGNYKFASSQMSAPILLEKDKLYYIESLYKQGLGADFMK
jgi:hypothetical protein